MEREFRSEWQWSSSNSSTFTRVARRHRIAQKIMPCINDDFSSSLARSKDICDPNVPPRVAASDFLKKNRSYLSKSRKQSRRNSLDRYDQANCCEKGDVLETVRSIGSLGSAPTLVESHKDIGWRLSEASLMSSQRRMSSPTLSPITPISPCVLKDMDFVLKEVEDEDEIMRYP
jgi:hypothetical protein